MRRGIIAAASAQPWNPENLALPASVYADWFRADLSAPAQLGGILTRWTGLRAVADPYARFDLTPYPGFDPSVTANGPNGENVIEFSYYPFEAIVGSEDRGGASNFQPQAPFNVPWEGAGFTIGFCAKLDGVLNANWIDGGEGDVRVAATDTVSPRVEFQYLPDSFVGTPSPAPYSSAWRTFIVRRKADGTADVYYEGVLVDTLTGLGSSAQSRWLIRKEIAAASGPVFGWFHARSILADADIANLHTWLKG